MQTEPQLQHLWKRRRLAPPPPFSPFFLLRGGLSHSLTPQPVLSLESTSVGGGTFRFLIGGAGLLRSNHTLIPADPNGRVANVLFTIMVPLLEDIFTNLHWSTKTFQEFMEKLWLGMSDEKLVWPGPSTMPGLLQREAFQEGRSCLAVVQETKHT